MRHLAKPAWAGALLLAIFTQAFGSTADAAPGFRTVALTGQQAPGADPGVTFRTFGTAALNGAGQTAFSAMLSGPGVTTSNSSGLYGEGSGLLAIMARRGEPLPGVATGETFGSFSSYTINDAGQIGFSASVLGPDRGATGVFSDSSGTLLTVARTGSQAPIAQAGVPLPQFLFLSSLALNASGRLAFRANVVPQAPNPTNFIGVYSDASGTLSEVVRGGIPAPGAGDGVVFGGLSDPVLNTLGQTAFVAGLSGVGVTLTSDTAIYSEGSGTLTPVAREGGQAPGAPTGVLFGELSAKNPPSINPAGQTAFVAFLTGLGVTSSTDSGIYSEGSGTLREVARAGGQAPGYSEGTLFTSFTRPLINVAGHTAFIATVNGAGPLSGQVVYVESEGILAKFVGRGEPVPGAPEGVTFSSFPTGLAFNALGQLAFTARLTGAGVDRSNESGIYATSPTGVLLEIARTGDLFDVSSNPLVEDLRTISSLQMITGNGNGDGRPSGFNDLGQVAFRAIFTDGTQGLFVSDLAAVPEPSAATLIVVGLLMPCRRH